MQVTENSVIIFKCDYLEVRHNAEHTTVEYKWIGFVNDEKSRAGMTKITEAIVKYKTPYLLADLWEFKGGTPETAKYVQEVWIEDIKKAGVKKIALNVPESIFGEISSQKALGDKGSKYFQMEKFTTYEQVYNWL